MHVRLSYRRRRGRRAEKMALFKIALDGLSPGRSESRPLLDGSIGAGIVPIGRWRWKHELVISIV